jgi:hypothetical protein
MTAVNSVGNLGDQFHEKAYQQQGHNKVGAPSLDSGVECAECLSAEQVNRHQGASQCSRSVLAGSHNISSGTA